MVSPAACSSTRCVSRWQHGMFVAAALLLSNGRLVVAYAHGETVLDALHTPPGTRTSNSVADFSLFVPRSKENDETVVQLQPDETAVHALDGVDAFFATKVPTKLSATTRKKSQKNSGKGKQSGKGKNKDSASPSPSPSLSPAPSPSLVPTLSSLLPSMVDTMNSTNATVPTMSNVTAPVRPPKATTAPTTSVDNCPPSPPTVTMDTSGKGSGKGSSGKGGMGDKYSDKGMSSKGKQPTMEDSETIQPTVTTAQPSWSSMLPTPRPIPSVPRPSSSPSLTFSPSMTILPTTASTSTLEPTKKGMKAMKGGSDVSEDDQASSSPAPSHSGKGGKMKSDKKSKKDVSAAPSCSPESIVSLLPSSATVVPTKAPKQRPVMAPLATTQRPVERPVEEITFAPIPPISVSAPTLVVSNSTETNVRVTLSPYTILYTFNQSRLPLETDELELLNTTQEYLARFLLDRYPSVTALETQVLARLFRLTEPYQVNYTSTATFSTDSDALPALELDVIALAAFDSENIVTYLELLQSLPANNVFRTTTEVSFSMDSSDVDPVRQRNKSQNAQSTTGSIIAGVSSVLVVMGVALGYRLRQQSLHHNYADTKDDAGHVTVAGDTYMADSTVAGDATVGRRVRQTRFADEPYLMDDGHSIASRSEWGLLPRSDEQSDEEDPNDTVHTSLLEEEVPTVDALAHPMADTRPFQPYASVQECDEVSDDEDDLSVDDDVPMRVVDLIKKFTPYGKAPP